MADLLEKISVYEARANELEERLGDPAVASSPTESVAVAKELSTLRLAADASVRYRKVLEEIDDARKMLEDDDSEVRELAEAELSDLGEQCEAVEQEVRLLLVPKDPNAEKNAILEIRAGTGGDEAALFVADLFRMYSRYAEVRGWKIDPLSIAETDGGGIREIVVNVEGKEAFGRLQFECGVHRVQRVPTTESQGRIHTSTVTVAVLPEAQEVDIEIAANDVRVDRFRSSGPGGQSVNTTDSAIRLTHIPTGLIVQCQDQKSQHKNKAKAFTVLRSRLYDLKRRREDEARSGARKAQIGSGDRSEKIRTYNYPQSRVTDHRAGITLHKLSAIIEGDLDEILDGVHSKMAQIEMEAESE
jgi:peptide chain release factor 1